jgi:hypothetical protein
MDAAGLANITRALADMAPSLRQVMGEKGRSYYLQHYSKKHLLERLEGLFRNATLRRVYH